MKPDGRNIPVTEENKKEYVQLACQMKMTSSIRSQIKSFLEGFYEIIPKELISIFNEQELELLICGLPTIDIDDLKANTEYHKYTENSMQASLSRHVTNTFYLDTAGVIWGREIVVIIGGICHMGLLAQCVALRIHR